MVRAGLIGLLIVVLGWEVRAEEPGSDPPAPGAFEVEIVKDISYVNGPDADPKKQKLDLYLPKGAKDAPVVFFIHGGAWSSGDRRLYATLGAVLARNGLAGVIISYRLSPQVQHPSHIEDVARAFAWTYKNIREYGGDPNRILVTGQSAGGHLAALLATNERYLKGVGLTKANLMGCAPISGIYTFHGSRSRRILGNDPKAPEDASPIAHVSGDEPPFLILYADADFPGCRPMSIDFQKALEAQGVQATEREIGDRNHISIMVRAMLSDADPTTRALLDFTRTLAAARLVAESGE